MSWTDTEGSPVSSFNCDWQQFINLAASMNCSGVCVIWGRWAGMEAKTMVCCSQELSCEYLYALRASRITAEFLEVNDVHLV